MKVIVASTMVPFENGAQSHLAMSLEHELVSSGHDVDTFHFPLSQEPDELLKQLFALRVIDLSAHGDRLITLDCLSQLLRHPAKVCWLSADIGQEYILPLSLHQPWAHDALRQALVRACSAALGEARSVFCTSRLGQATAQQLGFAAEVLYPPLPRDCEQSSVTCGDYFLCLGSITPANRQLMAVESLSETDTSSTLVIAGTADTDNPDYYQALRQRVKERDLSSRVEIRSERLTTDEQYSLFTHCLAVANFSSDVDCHDHTSLEAFSFGKAVITTSDSGNPPRLVSHAVNGLVTSPDSRSVAKSMDSLFQNRTLARNLGLAGRERLRALGISWDVIIERLLA